ncbi:PREDICTED: transducin beta-like protein 3 isoform X2 [Polistes dominula]|uniref:Transducin beta-like protein 3 isoform X2 n=1 Tax=Polistes dominula TaxID=743375 RepID=A0ABM1I706_POLDO|nr:PREDICTED: transducin beta-like protein 3 isoform X2 [Polistes dominula]
MSKSILKEAFEIDSTLDACFTGGTIHWSKNGKYMFCKKYGAISVVSIEKGFTIKSFGETENQEDLDEVNCFALNNDDSHILAHCKSGLFKLWNIEENKLIKIWKSIHNGPVTNISYLNDHLMASGGSDGCIRLWDIQHQACLKLFKGIQGVISVLAFHPYKENLLFGAGDDTKIYGWDSDTGQQKILLKGHISKVTSLSFHVNGINLVSSGRDRVIILWDITTATAIRTLAVYEVIEGAFIVPYNTSLLSNVIKPEADSIYVATAGEKGLVTLWDITKCKQIYTQESSLITASKENGLSITHLLYNEAINNFAVVSADHNIIIYSMETFGCIKQIAGYLDSVLDITYVGEQDSHIAVASNSSDIKLYELNSMNCQLLCGHTDIVLSLATTLANRQLLISTSKDNSIRVWFLDKETKIMACIASAVKHTAAVGCVCISQLSAKFFVSASQDSCLKFWSLPENLSNSYQINIESTYTVSAHTKDINSVAVSLNDEFIATGSQDKTAKLWSANNLQLIGTFNGHRKGVWCVRFSPIDKVLLTTSADCTIKIWSLHDLTCLKTFQGHESSVLKAEFMSRGMQLVTSGADGLIKIWCIKTSECTLTMTKHEDRVWGLTVSKDEKYIISGGSDSLLIVWKDATEEKKARIIKEKERIVLEEQKLANLLQANELTNALKIALELERPFQVLKIVEGILKKDKNDLQTTISGLTPSCKQVLLRSASKWNTNSKNAEAAQTVINVLISEMEMEDMKSTGLLSFLEGMIPYTERHFKRVTEHLKDIHSITYTINRMKPHVVICKTNKIGNSN